MEYLTDGINCIRPTVYRAQNLITGYEKLGAKNLLWRTRIKIVVRRDNVGAMVGRQDGGNKRFLRCGVNSRGQPTARTLEGRWKEVNFEKK